MRVHVDNSAASNDGIDLSQVVAGFDVGGYQLTFWGLSSRDETPVTLNSRKNGGDWHNFGLDAPIVISSQWTLFNITFASSSDGTPGRLSWFMGDALPNTSIWINSPGLVGAAIPRPVLIREFECGTVVLNGDTSANTVELGAGLQRLLGQQAPLWQYFVDDNSTAFTPLTGSWTAVQYDNGYSAASPTQEQVRPSNGFYHHWESCAHQAPAGSSASFALGAPEAGVYNVSLWWPAAVPARNAWSQSMRVSITPGSASTTIDLTTQGGDMFFVVATNVQLTNTSTLLLECPAGSGDCIADAVLIESAARWNDGSATGPNITIQSMDAVILNKTGAC